MTNEEKKHWQEYKPKRHTAEYYRKMYDNKQEHTAEYWKELAENDGKPKQEPQKPKQSKFDRFIEILIPIVLVFAILWQLFAQ